MPRIGYWIESLDDDQFLAPQEVAEKLAPDMVEKVVSYLQAGKPYEQYRGFSWCRFSCGCPSDQMGSAELTNGYWIWPEGLIHYVEAHRVDLPEAFLADALRKSAPKSSITEADPSLEFWKGWCAQNRSLAFRQQLMTARQGAEKEARNALREKITVLQIEYGVSDQICLCTGCNEKALQTKVFCAEHFLGNGRSGIDGDESWHFFNALLKDFGQEIVHKPLPEKELPR